MFSHLMVRPAQVARGLRSVLFALLIGVPQTQAAFAGTFASLGLDANIAVDPTTREWLSTLPQQWRDQINKIIEDSLRSLDAHLDDDLR